MSDFEIYEPELRRRIVGHLRSYGVPDHGASVTADVLIEGTLRGYGRHGIERLPEIDRGFCNGNLNPASAGTVLTENQAFTTYDGQSGLGPPLAYRAMGAAMEKAKQYGLGFAGTRNSSHIGIAGYYTELAARKGFFAIGFTTSSPAVTMPGCKSQILGTNPIAYSYPYNGKVLTADFSTSAISRGDVLQAQQQGKLLPAGVAVNAQGDPTQDPAEALLGGILPLGGGSKGLLLTMLVASLAILAGGRSNPDVTGTLTLEQPPTKSDVFLCLDIEQIAGRDHFAAETTKLIEAICGSSDAIRVPGSGSHRRREQALGLPIPISDRLAQLLDL